MGKRKGNGKACRENCESYEKIKEQKLSMGYLLIKESEFNIKVNFNYGVRIKYLENAQNIIPIEVRRARRRILHACRGIAYIENGETKNAIEEFNQEFEIIREILPEKHKDIPWILNYLGECGRYTNRTVNQSDDIPTGI